jgi:cystathionine gamma-synthase
MAAVGAVIDHVKPRRIAIPTPVYHGVAGIVARRSMDGSVDVVDPENLREGDLWWIESPSNPYCRIADLAEVTSFAAGRGVVTVCDSTLATPICLRPLPFGVDFVMHASTKGISGHSDAMGGILVVADQAVATELRDERVFSGAIPGSLDVWLSLRGVRTLPLRMERACASAMAVATWFERSGFVVSYPGLDTDPDHAVASRQMPMAGSMLAVDLGSATDADRFIGHLRLFTNATSLGGVESLVERRAVSDQTMPEGLVRISVGIEDTDDLIRDLDQARSAVAAGGA